MTADETTPREGESADGASSGENDELLSFSVSARVEVPPAVLEQARERQRTAIEAGRTDGYDDLEGWLFDQLELDIVFVDGDGEPVNTERPDGGVPAE